MTARLLDDYHITDADYTPLPKPYLRSVSVQRLPNTPDAEDYRPAAMSCSTCGSQSLQGRWVPLSLRTQQSPGERDLIAECLDCGETLQVDRITDLDAQQRPRP